MICSLVFRAVALVAAVGLAGCSISISSESMSASLDSSSKAASSPSASSKSGGSTAAYQADVRDYTAAYVRTGGDVEAFRGQLAELGRTHGITDWDANTATWEGVGEGLAKARVSGVTFETYLTSLTGSDPVKMNAVRSAYERARTR